MYCIRIDRDNSKQSLFKRMFRNSSYNVLATGINLLTFALLTPFLVKQLGVELYGIYITITAITGFMSIMDLGIAGASVRQFSHYYALKEYRKFNIVYSLSLVIYVFIGLFVFILIYVLLNTGMIPFLFGQYSGNSEIITKALLLSAGTVFFNMVLLVNSNISMALQQNDYYALGKIIITLSQAFLTIIFILLGYSLIGVVFAKLISVLIGITTYVVINKKIISSIKIVFEYDSFLFKDLVSFGFYNSLTQISNGLIGQLDKVIISFFLGPEFVTYYSIPMSAAQRIHSLVATAANVLFPVTSELEANNKMGTLLNLYKKSQNLILLLSSILILPFILFSNDILNIWLGSEFTLEAGRLFVIILISHIVIGSNIPSYFMFNGLNKPKYNAYYSLLTAFIKIITTLILIKSIGINGAAYSLLISTITVPIFITIFERKLDIYNFHFFFRGYIPVSISVLSVYLLKVLTVGSTTNNLFLLGALIILFSCIYLIILVVLGFFRFNKLPLLYSK